ncbi:MAG: phage replisome organizer N-terminal domain-containing protein, partial [Clostridium sp.]|uniref:phage replisome organizer N-terminal domain-containing protein n=1 Tax=Clostridium sp. TaxID=1506 RepID=UPI003F31B0FC
MAKKYYWLKLKEDFFRQKEIKKLRRIAGGDTYTIIYLKMLLLAMNNEYTLCFEGIEDDFSAELALELDEDTTNVQMTLAFLQNQNLIEIIDEDKFLLTKCGDMLGNDKTSTDRVRKHRLKKKEEQMKLGCNVSCNFETDTCNKNETLEKEKEKDIEKRKRREDTEIDNVVVVNCFNYIQQVGIPLSPYHGQELLSFTEDGMEEEVVIKAIDIAIGNGKRSYSYVKGILNKWIELDIKTIKQLEIHESSYKNKKSEKESKADEFDYEQ